MENVSVTMTAGDIESATVDASAGPIVFFDGVCGLCNSSVDFVLRHDQRNRLRFAPLQGETAALLLPPADRQNLGSLVLWNDGRTYRRSTAVVRVLWQLGPFWQFLGGLLWVIPAPLRNAGYRVVAALRYRLFGKKSACRLPTPEERSRFLD
jgi:predicted DCC family thiol-disulfide oxidoreductase YuxK